MRCSRCAHHDVVTIRLTISSEAVTYARCPRCDGRQWSGEGGTLSRERVLELVRSER